MKRNWQEQLKDSRYVLLLLFSGLLLRFFHHVELVLPTGFVLIPSVVEFGEKLSDAVLIAALLAFPVDAYLKRKLIDDLSPFIRGAHLPIELRREIDIIVRTETYRCDFEQTYTLEYFDSGKKYVRVETFTTFFVNNPLNSPAEFTHTVFADKLDYIPSQDIKLIQAGASGIIDKWGNRKDYNTLDAVFTTTADGHLEWRESCYIPANSEGQAKFWNKTSQVLEAFDEITFYSLYATVRQRIGATYPDTMEVDVTLGYHNEDAIRVIPADRKRPTMWILDAALLPMSAVTITWHKTNQPPS